LSWAIHFDPWRVPGLAPQAEIESNT